MFLDFFLMIKYRVCNISMFLGKEKKIKKNYENIILVIVKLFVMFMDES